MKTNFVFARFLTACFIFLFFSWGFSEKASASPWASAEGYQAKTTGKFVFGLKHTLFSWMNPWAEAHDPVYETPWTGFCAGIGKSVVYTAAGAIQLVTFPIPVDFPDVGLGMHIPANVKSSGAKAAKKNKIKPSGVTAEAADLKPSPASTIPPSPDKTQEKPTADTAVPNSLDGPLSSPPKSTAALGQSPNSVIK